MAGKLVSKKRTTSRRRRTTARGSRRQTTRATRTTNAEVIALGNEIVDYMRNGELTPEIRYCNQSLPYIRAFLVAMGYNVSRLGNEQLLGPALARRLSSTMRRATNTPNPDAIRTSLGNIIGAMCDEEGMDVDEIEPFMLDDLLVPAEMSQRDKTRFIARLNRLIPALYSLRNVSVSVVADEIELPAGKTRASFDDDYEVIVRRRSDQTDVTDQFSVLVEDGGIVTRRGRIDSDDPWI